MNNILVVDDENDFADVLKILLEEEGYHVRVARDGQEALDLLREVRADVILLDIMMPRMNGFEVLKAIKSWPDRASIGVLVMSVARIKEFPEKGDWQCFIPKPFDLLELLEKVRQFMDRSQSVA